MQFTRNLGSATGTALLGTMVFGAFTLANAELAAGFAETVLAWRVPLRRL